MGYKHHIFFSYKRDPLTIDWHREVVARIKLYVCMELNLDRKDFHVFFDEKTIEAGDEWVEELSDAIKSSKCLVAIWSPDYFHSPWCLTEFHSFLKRQEDLKKKGIKAGLIIPASYHDGQHFPSEAKAIQFLDFTEYASTISAFWRSSDAVEFEKKIKEFAKSIANKIENAPNFDVDFPFWKIENVEENNITINRIG